MLKCRVPAHEALKVETGQNHVLDHDPGPIPKLENLAQGLVNNQDLAPGPPHRPKTTLTAEKEVTVLRIKSCLRNDPINLDFIVPLFQFSFFMCNLIIS